MVKSLSLEEALRCCRDRHEYPDIFKDDIGSDLKLEGYIPRINSNRTVRAEISSYVGISWNAIHYYCNLVIDGVSFSRENDLNCYTYDSNTRKFEDENPLAKSFYTIEIVRELTQKEIDSDKRRWEYYQAGALTNCFETEQELIDLAKQVVKARFEGDWTLRIEPIDVESETIHIKDL